MNLTQNCSFIPYKETIILEGTLSGIGLVICAASIFWAVVLKLHRQLIYRLAIYQVLSALAIGFTSILDVAQVPIIALTERVYLPLCLANAFLQIYTFLVKICFTFLLTIHLFVFVVYYKNLKKLEYCYVTSSLLIPAVLSVVPFVTNTYGQQYSNMPWCWIQEDYNCSRNKAGVIELFALSYGPAIFISIVSFILMGIMLAVLSCRSCSASHTSGKNTVAIKQILPLMSYPLLFFVLVAATLPNYIQPLYYHQNAEFQRASLIEDQAAYNGVVWSAGLTLLIHVGVVDRKSVV